MKNRSTLHGIYFDYIPSIIVNGETVIQLDKDAVEEEKNKWRCALIAYVIGYCPGYNYMKGYISRNWGEIAEPELYLHKDVYYIVRFNTIKDIQKVLYSGPHTINNRSTILK